MKKELEENLKTTVGKIYRYSGVPKKSKRIYYYEFYLNGKKHKGSSTGYMLDGVSVGNYYQIEYSGINPDNNRMNFDLEFIVNFEKDSIGNISDTNYIRLWVRITAPNISSLKITIFEKWLENIAAKR